MPDNVAKAKAFVQSIDLKGAPRSIPDMDAAADAGVIFDKAKDQAQVVGSAVFAFQQGVDALVREAITNSALLAQLHANNQVKFEQDPQLWFTTYSEVLENIGWTIQGQGWSEVTSEGTQAEVNEKIIELLTVALGPSPAALAVIVSTLKALKGMSSGSPWLTLFSREVKKAKIARFQIGLVSTDKDGDVLVNLVACILNAKHALTQVLFFKFSEAHASFKADTIKVTINRPLMTEIGPAVRNKIRAYVADYLSSIKDV